MRALASLAVLASACAAFSANQPGENISRRTVVNGIGWASAAAAISVVNSAANPPAPGAERAPPASPLNGVYRDPNHKAGYRVVRTSGKSTAIVTLQDEPNGPVVEVVGKLSRPRSGGAGTVALDLSPKGGPKDVVATIGEGTLTFPDGNAWTKLSGVDGVYSDPNHPAGYRIVRRAKNEVLITLRDEPNGEVIDLVGKKKGKDGLAIDFGPKGGPKDLGAKVAEGSLVFPDGNRWTKL
ncbi:hypothetical protein ACHAWF_005153 [Thalassiosira exigua]